MVYNRFIEHNFDEELLDDPKSPSNSKGLQGAHEKYYTLNNHCLLIPTKTRSRESRLRILGYVNYLFVTAIPEEERP